MNIIKSISSFISSEYENETYFIRRKTQTFYYSILISMLLVILMMAALLLLRPHGFLRILLALNIIFVIITTALILLKKGHYYVSANIVVAATSLVLILFLFIKLYRDPHTGYTTSLYIMCSIIVTAALFCTKKWLIGTGLVYIASNIVFYCLVIKRLDELNRQAAKVGVIYSLFAMCLILLLSYLIVAIAEGAVTRSEEETEKSLKNYFAIQSLLESVRESAVSMAKSSGEMKSLTITFSDNFQNQASAAEEITAAMEEVSTSTDNNAASASEQSETILSFLEKLGNLSRTVTGMGGKIRQSTDDVKNISHDATSGETLLNSMQVSMEKINNGSIRMTSIVEIINSISDKINLLSLNAAIEAARAGDAGRGFAVVADEVSKLADQTAASLKEIAELIKLNMDEINRGSEIMNTTVDTIKRIINGVTTIKDTIREIGDYMSQQTSTNHDVNQQAEIVKNRTEEIKSSSYEQKTASDEVLKSILQVNDITQNNSEILGRLKDVSEEVAHLADYLRGKVSDSAT